LKREIERPAENVNKTDQSEYILKPIRAHKN